MAIKTVATNPHWNYFIALEHDLETLSRYVEFNEQNFQTYSIELAHLLLTAASEVDVLAKRVCSFFTRKPRSNIYQFQETITDEHNLPGISTMQVFVPRCGLILIPWSNWAKAKNPPDWWHSYNNVKHKRNQHFDEATLKNALNAMGALLIMNFHYLSLSISSRPPPSPEAVTGQFKPDSTLLRLPSEYYGVQGYLDNLVQAGL